MSDTASRGSNGRWGADYPRPLVTVRTAVLIPDPADGMVVLQVRRRDALQWALPATFLHMGERLAYAVKRSLRDEVGLHDVIPHQLGVIDEPGRDDLDWRLCVAHSAVVSADRLVSRLGLGTRLMPTEGPDTVIHRHVGIIANAVMDIRSRYSVTPDPDRLLADRFTVRELRKVHGCIAGEELDRDWFRRVMKPHLEATGTLTEGTSGRPAELFRRR